MGRRGALTLTGNMRQHQFLQAGGGKICTTAPHPNIIHLGPQPNLFMAN